jgi:hypothetical protein
MPGVFEIPENEREVVIRETMEKFVTDNLKPNR